MYVLVSYIILIKTARVLGVGAIKSGVGVPSNFLGGLEGPYV